MSTRKMYYRCIFDDDRYSQWIDPGKRILERHQANRFWNYGKLFNIYESIHRELKYLDLNVKYLTYKDKVKPDSLFTERNNRIIETPQYKMASNYFTTQASHHFKGQKIKNIQFMYVASTLPPIKNKKGKITYEVILFPTINFANKNS